MKHLTPEALDNLQEFLTNSTYSPFMQASGIEIANELLSQVGESPEAVRGVVVTIGFFLQWLEVLHDTAPTDGTVHDQTLHQIELQAHQWTMVLASLALRPEVRLAVEGGRK